MAFKMFQGMVLLVFFLNGEFNQSKGSTCITSSSCVASCYFIFVWHAKHEQHIGIMTQLSALSYVCFPIDSS